jgi:hypothetical protein
VIGTGEDAGFIYQLYGFGLLANWSFTRKPVSSLKVIQHATNNGAKILGKDDTIGRDPRRVQS